MHAGGLPTVITSPAPVNLWLNMVNNPFIIKDDKDMCSQEQRMGVETIAD